MALWLGIVMLVTGIAGARGKLPGVEPAPYIIRFTEDRPNPLYRRVCYTFAWSAAITFAVLNIAGLVDRDRDRAVVSEADLSLRVFPDSRHRLAARRDGTASAGDAVNQRGRSRTAIFLRHGLGHVPRAAGVLADVVRAARTREWATRSS